MISLAFAGLLVGGLFYWFLRLEREGRGAITVLAILGLVVLEAIVYQSQNDIPGGIFHPGGGGHTFRLVDVVIPMAFAARVIARGFGRRIDVPALWWILFLTWLTAAGVMGYENGNSRTLIAYEGKAVIYLGAFVLAAGIRPGEYFVNHRLERFIYGAAALTALADVMDQTQIRINLNNKVLPLVGTGMVSADAGTVLGGLGIIALALAVCREQQRLGLLFASVPLVFAALVCGQRAAVLELGLSSMALVVLCVLRANRLKTTFTELLLVLLVGIALYALPPLVRAASGSSTAKPPLVSTIHRTFGGQANQLSAASRVDQWRAARQIISHHPWLGNGLGTTYRFYDPGPQTYLETNLTHEIYLDLWLRTGVVGLILFTVATIVTILGGVRAWWHCRDDLVAALALGTTSVFIGLLGKGLVESLFEKYRIAVFIGLVIGMLCSAASALQEATDAETEIMDEHAAALRWS